ncbi:PREDICTED: ankyrin-3-like [Fragaria vesca subsp. vesca]
MAGRVENSVEYFEPYVQFTEFVSNGEWDKAKECLKLKDLDLHRAVRAIDPRYDYGRTAMHVAAWKGHVNIVKELMMLMTHKDLKMGDARGNTALHVAAGNGQLQTVKELVLLMGEKIYNDGDTALHVAVQWEEVDVVKGLVSLMRQTDLKIKNNNGDTALHLAVKKRNVAMMKYLAALIGEVRGPDGDTALHRAVKLEDAKVVKELVVLMKEEDLAIENDEGYTALHLAVKKGIVPVVKEFMTKELKEREFHSDIQFTTYVTKGEWDNAKEYLTKLDEPCNAITIVDPRDGYGNTALHVAAAREGHAHIVKELISLLKVRQEIQEWQTIEDIAAFGSAINLGVTEEVVRKKAKNMVEQYDKLLTSILEVQNAYGATAVHIAVANGNLDTVKELVPLMRKEGLEIQDAYGFTALLRASIGLELKAAKDGCNALHLAVVKGHMNIAREVMPFMRKEALEEKDGADFTALGCALAVRKDEDVMEIAKYMAENNDKVFGGKVPPLNWIPVVKAVHMNRWHLCRFLYPLTPLEYLMPVHGQDGASLIHNCFRAKELGKSFKENSFQLEYLVMVPP